MDKLIELLKQIEELAGVAIDALEGATKGEGGGERPGGEGGAPKPEGGERRPGGEGGAPKPGGEGGAPRPGGEGGAPRPDEDDEKKPFPPR